MTISELFDVYRRNRDPIMKFEDSLREKNFGFSARDMVTYELAVCIENLDGGKDYYEFINSSGKKFVNFGDYKIGAFYVCAYIDHGKLVIPAGSYYKIICEDNQEPLTEKQFNYWLEESAE